jgi:DNA-binding MarR family transcriptional regulator
MNAQQPTLTTLAVREPVVVAPVVTELVIAEPVVGGSAVAKPVVTGSAITGPAVSEPVAAESAVEDPVATEQAANKPAAAAVFEAMRRLVLEQEDRRNEVAEALGVSFSRVRALRRLAAGPQRMSALTVMLATDKPYTTLIVDDLERRGLVERSIHPDDRRCKIVTLTETGQEAAARAEEIVARPPKSLLALDPGDLTALEQLLAKL